MISHNSTQEYVPLKETEESEAAQEYIPLKAMGTEEFVPSKTTTSRSLKFQESIFYKQRSALPSFAAHCTFQWHKLNVFVGNETDGKHILHNFNGIIESGQLLAVMGGSGAGKSTLLNTLSGRTNLNQQTVKGYLAINGKKFKVSNQKIIKSVCTFVPQSDELCATQTVEEALSFYAKLKLSDCSKQQQEKRINYLIDVLHLNKCRNNRIGSEEKRGISGGEQRRVSIAAEILNDTDIIFLDEPTSGLDAYTAARTIKTLKQFCLVSNKIIIATIHQPSIEVFYLFDKLILLANGKCCFNSYIKDIDVYFKNQLRPKTNPADVIVFEAQRNSIEYAIKWENASFNLYTNEQQIENAWNQYQEFEINNPKNKIKTNGKTAPKTLQYKLLLKRELRGLIRNKRVTVVRIIQVLFFALACGFCYFDIAKSYSERAKAIFLMCIMPLLFGIVSLLTVFPEQKLLFQREYNSNAYNITSWAASFMIIEIPREIIHMFIFTVIVYFMIGFDGDFFEFWFTFFLTSVSGGSLGIFFGTICRNTVEAAQAVPAALIPLLIFSDNLIKLRTLSPFIRWIAAVNPLYYLIRCFYIIEFYGVVYPRNLGEDEERVCNGYHAYYNMTNRYILDKNGTNVYNYSICNNTKLKQLIDDFNQSVPQFTFNSTDVIIPTYQIPNYNNTFTTTESEEGHKLDQFCMTEIPWKYFFDSQNLDPNALFRYWLTIISICVVLRVVAILILLVIQNNGFSWIQKRINTILKCQICVASKQKRKDSKSLGSHYEILLK